MLRFLGDENLKGDIQRGLLRRQPELDLVRVQDVGLSGSDDPTVLAWAAEQGRIVLTHDRATCPISPMSELGQESPCQASLWSRAGYLCGKPSRSFS